MPDFCLQLFDRLWGFIRRVLDYGVRKQWGESRGGCIFKTASAVCCHIVVFLGTFCRLAGLNNMLSSRVVDGQLCGRLFNCEAFVRSEQFQKLLPLALLDGDVASLLANCFLGLSLFGYSDIIGHE